MQTMWQNCAFWALCIVMVVGCQPDGPSSASMNDALNALKTTSRVWVADGAHDFHVGLTEPAMQALLTHDGISVLIAHLDDSTQTATVLQKADQQVVVPLGYLCLDLLLQISAADSPVFSHPDAGDDAPWPAVGAQFFFPPEVLMEENGVKKMRQVRSRWEKQHLTWCSELPPWAWDEE